MRVLRLALSKWRNIDEIEYKPNKETNVIYGKNAQGKTNLLESIYIASRGTGFRQGKEKDLVKEGFEKARISLDFFGGGREQNISVTVYADKRRKEILLNGLPIKKNSDMAGAFCTVLFAPEHLSLVRDGPEERRKFLDSAISQLRPRYGTLLADYNKVVAQKNNLLKRGGGDTLDVWNSRLAEIGSYIVLMRSSYIKRLSLPAISHHEAVSKGEKLSLSYKCFTGNIEGLTREEIKNLLYEEITMAKFREEQMGISLVGPHRDDLEVLIDGKAARIFGSQGQQRSAVLSLKLAECKLIEEEIGERPVLLLDDVMSELDRTRQSYIRKSMKDRQVFITTAGVSKNGDRMEEGRLCTST